MLTLSASAVSDTLLFAMARLPLVQEHGASWAETFCEVMSGHGGKVRLYDMQCSAKF